MAVGMIITDKRISWVISFSVNVKRQGGKILWYVRLCMARNGKMGRAITTTLAKEDAEVEIVAGVDAYTEVANEYPVFDSIEKCDVEADVVIDFSKCKGSRRTFGLLRRKDSCCSLHNRLSEEQLQKVEEASKKVAVLRSANMSLGINLFDASFLKEATKVTVSCRL